MGVAKSSKRKTKWLLCFWVLFVVVTRIHEYRNHYNGPLTLRYPRPRPCFLCVAPKLRSLPSTLSNIKSSPMKGYCQLIVLNKISYNINSVWLLKLLLSLQVGMLKKVMLMVVV